MLWKISLKHGPIAVLLFMFLSPVGKAAESFVLGYYPAGMRDRLPAEQVDFKTLTHLCHAFIRPKTDGTLDYSDRFLYPELVQAAHAAGREDPGFRRRRRGRKSRRGVSPGRRRSRTASSFHCQPDPLL